jgi:hypothetical protein
MFVRNVIIFNISFDYLSDLSLNNKNHSIMYYKTSSLWHNEFYLAKFTDSEVKFA